VKGGKKRPRAVARTELELKYGFYPIAEVAEITNLGRDLMTRLIAHGAPILGRKMNVDHFVTWVRENQQLLNNLKVRNDQHE
jgi:hypothetical protein